MSSITFLHPNFFYLLLGLIPMIGWYIWKQKSAQASLQISSLKGFENAPVSWKVYFRHVPFALRSIAIIFLIIVLARPQSSNSSRDVVTEGIDIVMTLDISSSMEALDFKPNRLEAAKDVATEFMSARPNDKIGLVIFAGESFTQCPLTTDKAVLVNLTHDIKTRMVEDGTAIGLGLATAVNRIKDSDAKSKVIILLTDGVNNRGEVAPLTAAEIAKTFGIRVYTIGVGSEGKAQIPVQTPYGTRYVEEEVKIDEPMMKEIAETTGGQYFRATNKTSLKKIYEEIDQMEKTKIEVKEYTKRSEEYLIFAILAALFILMEVFIKSTILRNLP
ncbi:vWA domain-containing protein [Plebeiibacterium sediminum]|uniref:VWA domain-containing protein n=1 Tax=Plebeiibacterium sediminum TaxID=2992112 RepID=A0AAE3M5J3_9BACT|nr:VWA domain-containing protein [Plebeiobacterium sediminum]MCW3787045.1 VWA domain-containing protein [Plebeiobacterium sediminum]